ncbi:telomere repeat-binding protein 5 isoform X1 [Nymphaea colorata]|nr:telomere repeat-binding protein 5 isoform X1 [Nymphaea colorata]XP_031485569.1 telomere repeat-binding protein 5 isoform X1 [Nymphaea colorata]XP_031485570.1 telomere repeat-binding protein 5 isoform X1 [Nymphaea colorata]XP_031485571.1 telomere repeat-binding protein 5 isoform X1 [Nymphaea colorata]
MQKRLECGFNCYQVPTMPRTSRSARGKRLFRKKDSHYDMHAFELLATVAGKLLCENESFPTNCDSSVRRDKESAKKLKNNAAQNVKKAGWAVTGFDSSLSVSSDPVKEELQNEVKPFKLEVCDQGISDEGPLASRDVLHCPLRQGECHTSGEGSHVRSGDASGSISVITKFDSSLQARLVGNSVDEVRNNVSGVSSGPWEIHKHETDGLQGKCAETKSYPCSLESPDLRTGNPNSGYGQGSQVMISRHSGGTIPDTFSSQEPIDEETKPPALVSSASSDEVSFCIGRVPYSSSPVIQEDVKIVQEDDDENSSGCSKPSNVSLQGNWPRLADRKIRKVSSNIWKAAPAMLKDGKPYNNDVETKPAFYNRKTNCKRQRTQRCPPVKRRRLFQQSLLSIFDGGIGGEDASTPPEKHIYEDISTPDSRINHASGASSPIESTKSSVKANDSKVKLNIKSFKVPELLIEMPENATVGSLKRTVMEAVTSILGGGLQVGILLQGKKIHDDSKTLLQTGISCSNEHDDVGFMLEPNTIHAPKFSSTDPCPPLSPKETEPLNRYNPLSDNSDLGVDEPTAGGPLWEESDCNQTTSPAELSTKNANQNSRALVAVPTVSVEALAVVPLHCKPRRSELVQRRTRRPFSVPEVEALVKAVEKLGTGRWRDVKLLAFDNAKHRTYVDLKDKWKTLVHTARISPQQRRGEPVPQELLDRVLSAHAYWSQQQAKHQVKQQGETRLLL